jgi:predicted GNAT family acetyltransferase
MDRVTDTPQIADNQAASRFEVTVNGQLAELRYRRHGQRFVLVHTGVPPELEGRGLGSALVAAAVERTAREGLTVVPLCPFAQTWLTQHADVAATLTIDWGGGSGNHPPDAVRP